LILTEVRQRLIKTVFQNEEKLSVVEAASGLLFLYCIGLQTKNLDFLQKDPEIVNHLHEKGDSQLMSLVSNSKNTL
jgi:hypothetical protein